MQNPSTHQQDDTVQFAPPDLVERRFAEWPGLRADIIEAKQKGPFDYRYSSNHHLLIASECSERERGETMVEGLPKSTRRSISQRLTFVPAGHALSGWQDPRVLTRVNYFYIDRRGPLLDNESGFAETEFRPQLFFSDPDIWRIAAGLKNEAVSHSARVTRYGEALGVMLGHELVRLNNGRAQPVTRGGLSGWQRKKVAEFIEEHLAEEIRLTTLAGLVELSPYHFARAFKQSFGLPPHRYHSGRRIEHAKTLLAERTRSVTEVGLTLGFAETSSFSATFHKLTGTSPSDYRRALE